MKLISIILASAIVVVAYNEGAQAKSTAGVGGAGTVGSGDRGAGAGGSGSVDAGAGGSGSVDGNVQVGGCSVGASGSVDADGSAGPAGSGGNANGSGGASANCGGNGQGGGYTYDISATRIENIIAPGYPILYMYYKVSPGQNLTMFDDFGPDNPFLLETYVTVGGSKVVFSNDAKDAYNACTDYHKTGWAYVAVEIFNRDFIPDGSCSVSKGSYPASVDVPTFSVTFPEMIPCGVYNLTFNVDAMADGKLRWGGQFKFTFTIPDDANCASE